MGGKQSTEEKGEEGSKNQESWSLKSEPGANAVDEKEQIKHQRMAAL